MVVTWVTVQSTNMSIVEYGIKDLNRRAKGFEEVFIDGGSEKRMMYIHRVTVTGLQAGQKYREFSFADIVVPFVDYSGVDLLQILCSSGNDN